jgi:hypothetical protein
MIRNFEPDKKVAAFPGMGAGSWNWIQGGDKLFRMKEFPVWGIKRLSKMRI